MKRKQSSVALRRTQILDSLRSTPNVSVKELAEIYEVTQLTIRRDFQFLEDNSQIIRYHGGAKIPESEIFPHTPQTKKLGKFCATLIENYDSVFVNANPYAHHLISNIKANNVTVFTNILNYSNLQIPYGVTLVSCGGSVCTSSNSFYGDIAIANLSKITARKSFIWTSGISTQNGFSCDFLNQSAVNTIMYKRTIGQTYVLATSSAFNKTSSFTWANTDENFFIITDDDSTNVNDFELRGFSVRSIS